jgi:hypothetical protein
MYTIPQSPWQGHIGNPLAKKLINELFREERSNSLLPSAREYSVYPEVVAGEILAGVVKFH